MTITKVTIKCNSTAILKAVYIPADKTLDIYFAKSGIYRCFDVQPTTAEAFAAAASKGQFYNSQIRPLHTVERVKVAKEASAPAEHPKPAHATQAPPAMTGHSFEWLLAMPIADARAEFERWYIQAQLDRNAGNKSQVAAQIGMERTAFQRKCRELNLLHKAA